MVKRIEYKGVELDIVYTMEGEAGKEEPELFGIVYEGISVARIYRSTGDLGSIKTQFYESFEEG